MKIQSVLVLALLSISACNSNDSAPLVKNAGADDGKGKLTAEEAVVEVRLTDGSTGRASGTELLAAYADLQQKLQNANTRVTNEDGSVTIFNPRFLFNGLLMPIMATDSATGWCVRNGFQIRVARGKVDAIDDEDYAKGIRLLEFSEHGDFEGLHEAKMPGVRGPFLAWVTCK